MVSRFASVTEEQILSTNKAAVPKNTKKMAKTFCLIFPTQILKHKKGTMPCLRGLSSIIQA